MSDSSDHYVSVVVFVVVVVNFSTFLTSNFVLMFLGFVKIGIRGNVIQFLANSLKSSTKPLNRNHWYLVWRVTSGQNVVSSLFKLGFCELKLRFKNERSSLNTFFDIFPQSTGQILRKFRSYMNLSNVSQVCSNHILFDLFSLNYANYR